MENKQQKIKDLQAMLDTGLVNDETIIKETKATIAQLQAELDSGTTKAAPKPKATKSRKKSSKDYAHSWKAKTPIKNLQPVVLHCQHYQKAVTKPMTIGIKGTGNRTVTVTANPGDHLIFDDQGHLVFVMNAASFARKCTEKTSIAEHIEDKHEPAEKKVTVPVSKPKAKVKSTPKKKAPKATQKTDNRRSPVAVLESEIKDVAKIVAKKTISKEDAAKLPAELKDITARSGNTSTINYIKKKAKKIDENQKLSEAEVIKLALAAQPLVRSVRSILLDTLYANKKRLAPTTDGLLRWLSSPSRYDLIGVDVSKEASVTVKPKKPAKTLLQILKIES